MLENLADELAERIPSRCRDQHLAGINERDHLQPWAVKALENLVLTDNAQVTVSTSTMVESPDHWPRLGNVDISLKGETGLPVFLELKCGASVDALGPCAWDVLKLALLLRHVDARAGYLVAATTKEHWHQPARGAEFFDHYEWKTKEVRSQFADWFRMFEKRNDPPILLLPAGGTCERIKAVEFPIADVGWELRIARVDCDIDGWFEWQPLLAAPRVRAPRSTS